MIKNPYAVRTHQGMKEVLWNPDVTSGPEIYYYMIRGGKDKKNITVVESGLVGGEYIKTYGHYHVGQLAETYWIVLGEGLVLMQEREINLNSQPIDDKIKNFKAIAVKAGDEILIPSGMGHLLVNIGKTWLVTADDSPVDLPGHADYEPVKKLHGFAYFVIKENNQPVLVKNPCYQTIPEVRIVAP